MGSYQVEALYESKQRERIGMRAKQRKLEIEREIAKLQEELEIINNKEYSIGFVFGFGSPDILADFEDEVEELLKKYDGQIIDKEHGASEVR